MKALFFEYDAKLIDVRELHEALPVFRCINPRRLPSMFFNANLLDPSYREQFKVKQYKLIGKLRDDTLLYARENSRLQQWKMLNIIPVYELLDGAANKWDARTERFNESIKASDIWHVSWDVLLKRSRPTHDQGCPMVEFFYEGVAVK